MSAKIPIVVVLFTLILTASINGTAWSSGAAPTEVIYFDLVVDEPRQLLYGSDRDGGSIHIISMATLEIVNTVSVGAQPSGMDLSPDGSQLAVALFGQGEIAVLDLNTQEVVARLVAAAIGGLATPYDVIYGRPGRLYSVGAGTWDSVYVFDTATRMEVGHSLHPDTVIGRPWLALTADKNTLYIGEPGISPQQLYRFDITTDTPVRTAIAPHGPVSLNRLCVMPDNRVFTSSGQVWSPDLSTLLGTFPASGSEIECSESGQRVYITHGIYITVIDAASLSQLLYLYLPGTGGVARLDAAEEMIFVSTSLGVKRLRTDVGPIFIPMVNRDFCTSFFDDFSDPTSGWEAAENENVRSEYTNGEFLIHTKKSGYLYLYSAPACELENYSLEVDARWLNRTGQSYGLMFNMQDNFSSYYFFDVNTDYQAFRLYRRTPGGFTLIAPQASTSLILLGLATNHLRVTRVGGLITLYANGAMLGSWWDTGILGPGAFGILSSPYSDRRISDALFDNFYYYRLPSPTTAAGGAAGTSADTLKPPALENFIEPAPAIPDW